MKIQFVQNLHKQRMMGKHTIIRSIHQQLLLLWGIELIQNGQRSSGHGTFVDFKGNKREYTMCAISLPISETDDNAGNDEVKQPVTIADSRLSIRFDKPV